MKNNLSKIILWAGSLKQALALVIILIIISFLAIMFPQHSEFSAGEITTWSVQNPGFSKFAEFFGLFSVFRSVPFLIIIFLFALNIIICTILHLVKLKNRFEHNNKIRLTGFLFLHVALLGILAGGFITTSSGMDGSIILTEGQVFRERADNYIKLSKGPMHKTGHKNFMVRLNKLDIVYERNVIPVKVTTNLEFRSENITKENVEISINHPYEFRGLEFTQDEIGFSPRISINDPEKGIVLLHSFIALKTFREGDNWQYTDFLPLSFLQNRIFLTLYPDHKREGNKITKTGELPKSPLLLFEEKNENGEVLSKGIIPFKGSAKIGKYLFEFHELRYWASFRVMEDPGYLIFVISILLALFSLILRYSEDLKKLFIKTGRGE